MNAMMDYKLSEEQIKEMEEERKLWQKKTIEVRPEESVSLTLEDLWFGTCCNHSHPAEKGH